MPASRACSSQQCLVCHLYADTGYSWACLLPKPRAVQDRSSLETGPSRYTSRAMQVKRCSGAPRGNLKLHLMCWGGSGLGSMTEEREVGKGLWGWAEKLLTSLPLCLGSSTNLCATDTNKTLRSQPGSPHPPPLLLGAPGLASPLCSSLVHFSPTRYETGESDFLQPAAATDIKQPWRQVALRKRKKIRLTWKGIHLKSREQFYWGLRPSGSAHEQGENDLNFDKSTISLSAWDTKS